MRHLQGFIHARLAGGVMTLLLLLCLPLHAVADMAATVLFSQGTVTVSNAQVAHDLKKGDTIAAGDTVDTGNDGRVQLRFTDGGLVALKPNTRFAVDQYNQPSAKSEGSLSFNLVKGGLRTLSGTIGKKDNANYQLKTSVATLGIRGTQFIVSMDDGVMRVHVGQGAVNLSNGLGEQQVGAGQNGVVTEGSAPSLTDDAPSFASTGAGDGDDSGKGAGNGAGNDGSGSDASAYLAATLPPDYFNLGEVVDWNQLLMATGMARAQLLSSCDPGFCVFADVARPDEDDLQSSYNIIASLADFDDTLQLDGMTWAQWRDLKVEENSVVRTVGSLMWAEGNSILGVPDSWGNLAWVAGMPADTTALTGVLNYRLQEGKAWMNGQTDEATLTRFDLQLDLQGSQGITAWMRAGLKTNDGTEYDARTMSGVSIPGQGQFDGAFSFSSTPTTVTKDGGLLPCTGCAIGVAGILAGQNAGQAGVTFEMQLENDNFSGVAALNKTSEDVTAVVGQGG